MYFNPTVPGQKLTEGQEIKLGNRWRTIMAFIGAPDEESRLLIARDVTGRERICKVLTSESYPVRRGNVPEDQRFGFYECTTIRNKDHYIMGTVVVVEDDGGPVVKISWRTNALGLDVPHKEQTVDRERLGDSDGVYRARERAE